MNITTNNKFWLSQANAVINANKPLVFWDTCALLDILRIPLLEKPQFNIATLQAYEQLESWLASNRLVSITSNLVVREFSEHADNIVNMLVAQERKTKDEVKEQSQYMSDAVKSAKVSVGIDLLDIQKRVIKLVKKIWRRTYILRGQDEFALKADYRVRNYIKPSGGKESYKDCYLWICYISLLNKVNPTEPTFFFTSNPADFAENRKSDKLHPNLKAELPFPNSGYALKMLILSGKLQGYFAAHP